MSQSQRRGRSNVSRDVQEADESGQDSLISLAGEWMHFDNVGKAEEGCKADARTWLVSHAQEHRGGQQARGCLTFEKLRARVCIVLCELCQSPQGSLLSLGHAAFSSFEKQLKDRTSNSAGSVWDVATSRFGRITVGASGIACCGPDGGQCVGRIALIGVCGGPAIERRAVCLETDGSHSPLCNLFGGRTR